VSAVLVACFYKGYFPPGEDLDQLLADIFVEELGRKLEGSTP